MSGAHGGTRTPTLLTLNQTPLPVRLRAHSTDGPIRTDTAHALKVVTPTIGLRRQELVGTPGIEPGLKGF